MISLPHSRQMIYRSIYNAYFLKNQEVFITRIFTVEVIGDIHLKWLNNTTGDLERSCFYIASPAFKTLIALQRDICFFRYLLLSQTKDDAALVQYATVIQLNKLNAVQVDIFQINSLQLNNIQRDANIYIWLDAFLGIFMQEISLQTYGGW